MSVSETTPSPPYHLAQRRLSFIVTVNYATSNSTTTATADYTAISDVLAFAPGETTKQVNVTISTPPRAKALR